ncbi:mandelate racemase/muconate lactonizing enzyme family protein [Domibacillus sp. PGB-M46]|uniref:mandelate racemase/muconate lactonizing enzyme family protein n=1 Tax=Domibacillus sp. PGB-M46 TaxID=2910255 RepID=UPI001F56B1A3|nr:mandelate racemase/muconate lactonizing enzyme family protein [Domibacillus sp. PGB-M46]MCI2253421.1 mandelate racemase/muconate lactonizing enzyme family protein [Domibacillus sp. PGB-M46]
MQIEKIETFPLLHRLAAPYGDANGPKKYRSCYLIRITTKSGLDGWGECIDWLPALHVGFTERIIPYLIGKSAADRLPLVSVIQKWHKRAAAAVSMALTEIVAKSARLSVCDLWGGKWRDRIPVYASFQSYSDRDDWIGHSLRLVEGAIQKEFTAVKVKIGGRTFQDDLTHIHSLQKMTEERIPLILDANQSYDMAAARKWGPYLSNWTNLLWLEEPMPLNNLTEYKLLRASLSVPIAGGENIKSAKQFLPILNENAFDIIQPDILHGTGIDDFRNALQLARHFGVRVSPHSYDGALSRLYTLFAQASLAPWTKMNADSIEPVEWDVMENPFSELVPVTPSGGSVSIPDGIGIGVEINTDLLQAYRWDGSAYWQ